MSQDLRTDLASKLKGRTCVIGIGSSEWGDDAFGLDLASHLEAAGYRHVVVAGSAPESVVGRVAGGYDDILLLDALEYPGEPGSVVLLESSQLRSRYPQVSTHKLSLGALASVLEHETGARVWLLGAKPFSLAPSAGLTDGMRTTCEALKELLLEVLERGEPTVRSAPLTVPLAGSQLVDRPARPIPQGETGPRFAERPREFEKSRNQ